jgi:hypothetical protein
MNRLRAWLLVFVFTTAAAGGCVTGPPQSQSEPSGGVRLTRAELSNANTDNLYDAIAKLRPEWLSSRGPTSVSDATPTSVSVYMGGSMLGKADALRQLVLLDVSEVRYWDASRASARFGMGHPRGVIEIIRR